MLLQERDPLRVQQQAVGLQVVLDALAWPAVAGLQLDDALEEGQAHHRGLAALPREHDLVAGVGLQVLSHMLLEHGVAHARVAPVPEQSGLVQVEAVGAVEVAQRARRLDHRVEAVGTALR